MNNVLTLHTSSAFPGHDCITSGRLASTKWPTYKRYRHSLKDSRGRLTEILYWTLWSYDANEILATLDSPLEAWYDPESTDFFDELGKLHGPGQILLIVPVLRGKPYLCLGRKLDGAQLGARIRARSAEEVATEKRLRVREQ